MRRRHAMLAIGAAAQLALPLARATARPIRLGVIGLSFHGVVGGLAQEVLAAQGLASEVSNAAHDRMFEALGREEVDLLVTAWMPGTHAHLYRPIADRLVTLGTAYRDARLFWTVPEYVPAEQVASMADLARPEVAARMHKTIRSIGPSAGLSVRSGLAMRDYALDAAGYQLVTGDAALWVQQFRELHDRSAWQVMPLWQPHFLNGTHRMRVLQDPKSSLGAPDDAVIVASQAFMKSAPAAALGSLRRLAVDIEAVTAMDLQVNLQGLTPRQAARAWLDARPAVLAGWIGAAPR